MDIYAIKFWEGNSYLTYKLQRYHGELKWIVEWRAAMSDLLGRTYIDLGTSPEPYQWIIDFEPSHLSLELVSPL